jgi:TolA-binding protein
MGVAHPVFVKVWTMRVAGLILAYGSSGTQAARAAYCAIVTEAVAVRSNLTIGGNPMRGKIARIGLIMLAAMTLAGEARSQVTDGSAKESLPGSNPDGAVVEGRVVLPSGRSVSGMVRVTLEVGGSVVRSGYTDSSGAFRFLNVEGGVYSVRAYGDDRLYIPGSQDVRLQTGASMQLIIYLREKSTLKAENRNGGVVPAEDWDRLASRDARKAYDKAEKLIGKGQVDDGIEQLKQAISLYHDYVSARNALGAQFLKRNQLLEASEQFEYVLGKSPTYFNARFNLGLVRLQQQRYKDAVTELSAASSVDGSNATAHLWLGVARLQTEDFPGAERDLDRAQALGGMQLPATHYYMGQVYLRQNRKEDACKQFQEYLNEAATGDLASDSRQILQKCAAK